MDLKSLTRAGKIYSSQDIWKLRHGIGSSGASDFRTQVGCGSPEGVAYGLWDIDRRSGGWWDRSWGSGIAELK